MLSLSLQAMVNPASSIVKQPATQDDPKQRKPDIARAWEVLSWRPRVHVDAGLETTIRYFKHELGFATAADGPAPAIWVDADAVRDTLSK